MISNFFNSYNQTQPPNFNQLLNIESTYGCFFYTITQINNQLDYYCDCNNIKKEENSPLQSLIKSHWKISTTFHLLSFYKNLPLPLTQIDWIQLGPQIEFGQFFIYFINDLGSEQGLRKAQFITNPLKPTRQIYKPKKP